MKIDGQTDDCMGWDGMEWDGRVYVYMWKVKLPGRGLCLLNISGAPHLASSDLSMDKALSLSLSLSVNGEHFQPFMCVFRALF